MAATVVSNTRQRVQLLLHYDYGVFVVVCVYGDCRRFTKVSKIEHVVN